MHVVKGDKNGALTPEIWRIGFDSLIYDLKIILGL